jgi:phosphate/sulfate permease
VVLPCIDSGVLLSQAGLPISRTAQALPSPWSTDISAKAVPVWKTTIFEGVSCFAGAITDGRKVLLTMFARQFFPS